MRLRVLLPTAILTDTPVRKVTAEGIENRIAYAVQIPQGPRSAAGTTAMPSGRR
jgi:hypothetical protein